MEVLLSGLGAVLTLFVLSYLLGDNALFRLALHIFVGVSAAYVFVVALRSVLLPALLPPASPDPNLRILWLISLVGVLLGLLLVVRGVPGLSQLSALPVAILMGVGVGVALGGAILGTLGPQLSAAAAPAVPEILRPLGQVFAIVGTATGLLAFNFTGRRPARRLVNRLSNGGARVGRWFVLIGLGAAYGGVLVASLSFLADRVQYLIEIAEKITGG